MLVRPLRFVLCLCLLSGVVGYQFVPAQGSSELRDFSHSSHLTNNLAAQRYTLDASHSKFVAHALRGGLFWFKGHAHLVAVREFTGEAQLNADSIAASSLVLTAKTASMEETSSVFTDAQKKIINKELREIVLLPDQYPDIVFKSTNVSGKAAGANQYDLKINGDLTLLGVTRQITIPTKVTVMGNDLRAQGEFSINRSDFKVKATSAFHGLVRVRDKLKFEFDIVGHQS
ncbi:MAG TPA: YceI family protein [Pyrinomonadaceae bacterium]|jgi:polyisoprenoid-binding protein YceI|nr:YceI family protein [Pyrinomonadaceae bacterium]